MKTATLRGFFPTNNADVYGEGDQRFRLAGDDPIYDNAGCSGRLTLSVRGELLNVSVTSVAAGDKVVLHRPGQRDIAEYFDRDGVVLDMPIPARPQMLAALRGRTVQVDIDFLPVDTDHLSGVVRTARIAGMRLAKSGERGDCELRLID